MREPSRRRRPARTGPTRGRRRLHHHVASCARTVATRRCCGRRRRAACAATARRRHGSGCAAAWLRLRAAHRLGFQLLGRPTARWSSRTARRPLTVMPRGCRTTTSRAGARRANTAHRQNKNWWPGRRGPRRAVPARRTLVWRLAKATRRSLPRQGGGKWFGEGGIRGVVVCAAGGVLAGRLAPGASLPRPPGGRARCINFALPGRARKKSLECQAETRR